MYTLFETRNDPQSDPTIKSSGPHHQTHLIHQKSMAEMCLVVGPTRFNGWITLWVISSVKKCVHIALLLYQIRHKNYYKQKLQTKFFSCLGVNQTGRKFFSCLKLSRAGVKKTDR